MANWITHTLVADELLRCFPALDRRAFVVGNIAPDCNVENADWSSFTPPREVTHFMLGEKKTSADLDGFRTRHIASRPDAPAGERSFLLGYYSHLAVDVLFMRFIRDESRLRDAFARVHSVPELHAAIAGQPETLDTLKAVFGKNRVFADIIHFERQRLSHSPDPSYRSILPRIKEFPDYLDFLPPGAIARKIPIMLDRFSREPAEPSFVFFTEEEYANFLRAACDHTGSLIRACL